MLDIIIKNVIVIANNYVYGLLIITIFFAYHYDYKSLKKKKLYDEMKVTKGIVIVYSIILIGLIISSKVIQMTTY